MSIPPSDRHGGDNTIGFTFSEREFGIIGGQICKYGVWVTDEFMFFFMLVIAARFNTEKKKLILINSLLQSQLMGTGSLWDQESLPSRALAAYKDRMESREPGVSSVFLPLHANNHWSLLYYHGPTHQWFHYDSLSASRYHRKYACQLLQMFGMMKVIPEQEAKDAVHDIKSRHWNPPDQLEGWECGFFVLMYMNTIVSNGLLPITHEHAIQCSPRALDSFRRVYLADWFRIVYGFTYPSKQK